MTEGTDRPAGERRRRREAERAAEQAAAARPLTRRELRRLQEEEAARLEAAATGELPLGQPETTAQPAATTEAPDAGPNARATAVTAPTPASAPSAPSAPATAPTPVSAPSAASAPSSAREEGTSPAAPSVSPRDEPPRVPSRRSLRERDPQPLPEERPQERTATGRRPVVRTPSVARGVRSLDSTGQLTGIQPVVRPDAPDQQPGTPAAEDTTAPAVWSERSSFSLDAPARAARAALPAPETADSPEEPEDEAAPLRPRWVAIDAVSGASPESAASVPASRRALRGEDTEKAPADERNPAVAAIKAAVLVVVALILGALVWLLATEAFDGSAAAAPQPTTITTTHLEESSAS